MDITLDNLMNKRPGKVVGEVKTPSGRYNIEINDYNSSFYLSIEDEDGKIYSSTHDYSKLENRDSSRDLIEYAFRLALENDESWDSDALVYLGPNL